MSLSSKMTDIQLSSPLPSPNQQQLMTNDNTQEQQTITSSSTLEAESTLQPLVFEQPYFSNTDLYPLSNLETPQIMKKFTFHINGKPCKFEEVQTIAPRKRSASYWDDDDEDERSSKRTELDTSNHDDTTLSPSDSMVDIIPGSPNSALPSPVSDLDHHESWPLENTEQQPIEMTIDDSSTATPSHMIDIFDSLPSNIQTYFMMQLLKRSSRHTLRLANDNITEALKVDFLKHLPNPICTHILHYLDIRSLCRATSVSRTWKQCIDNASNVWKQKMIESDFIPTSNDDYKQIVRRHTIMRQNWFHNRHRKMVLEGHEDDLVTCLQFDNEKIITGSDDHSIHVYDIATGHLKRVLNGHDGGVWALQYVGKTLVTGSIDRTIRVWNIETGRCHFILRGHSSTVRCLRIIMPSPVTKADGTVAIEPREPMIISGSRDMTIRVWKLPDIDNDPELPLSTGLEDDVVSGRYRKFKLAEHEHSVRDLAVYGNTLVSGSYDNNVIIWDLETGKRVFTLKGHTMKVYCVAIDPKRRHCISGSLDASVRIWGLDDGECKFVLQGHSILVGLLGLVDDCLVSAAADATLRTWDPSNGDRLRIFAGASGHQGPITSFQHDKYKIVSGSEGGIKMWDPNTGKLLHDLIEDVAGVWRVCFDERRCIAAVKNEHKTQLIVLDFGIHGIEDSQ